MYYQIYLVLVLLLAVTTRNIQAACASDEDCKNQGWGEYSLCANGYCKCSEFFIIHPIDDKCIKVASYGQPCEDASQCQAVLGNDAQCKDKVCECFSITFPDDVFHYEGKCYVRKELGQPCTHDNQCIIDSNLNATNYLARCTDKVCSCIEDEELSVYSMNHNGTCMIHQMDDCDTVDISLLAIMLSGSAVLILFIYAVFRITKR